MRKKQVRTFISMSVSMILAIIFTFEIGDYPQIAYNLFWFYTWMTVIILSITISFPKENSLKQRLYKKYNDPEGQHMPKRYDEIHYTCLILILAAFGYFWVAGAWVVIASIDFCLREEAEEELKKGLDKKT